jgi:D-alanine-D-alanine ligase
MTATSLVPQAAAEAGYSFDDLIARLIDLGLSR